MSEIEPVILYVEDDMNSRKVMSLLLQRVMKLSVTIFENSANFIENVNQLPTLPNVVFLDIQMQPFDGYQVLTMLREDGRFNDTIIIAMTANVMSHDVEQLKKAGFNGLIGKPIMKDVFPHLVERILARESVWYVP